MLVVRVCKYVCTRRWKTEMEKKKVWSDLEMNKLEVGMVGEVVLF